jgi:hypothetical protein
MGYLKFIRYGNKLSAIPIAGRLFHGNPIGSQGDNKNAPTSQVIDFLKIHK